MPQFLPFILIYALTPQGVGIYQTMVVADHPLPTMSLCQAEIAKDALLMASKIEKGAGYVVTGCLPIPDGQPKQTT